MAQFWPRFLPRNTTVRSMAVPLTLVVFCTTVAVAEEAPTVSPADFFDRQVQPILAAHCFPCHGGEEKVRGGLRLTRREGLLTGGDSGPAVDLEDPAASLLVEAINYESFEMPPKGMLPEAERETLAKWIKRGMPWSATTEDFGLQAASEDAQGPPAVNDASRAFWSFQPIRRPAVPQVRDEAWVRNPVDAFLLRKLEENGLTPNQPAEKIDLLRRASYDLTGLPPSLEEVQAFLRDPGDDAYAKVLDRLLRSPHYGERWGRHWLDLVRYAESNSYERDGTKPFVWRYRDYVIRSLNQDKPYDRFVLEQLAGDELGQVTADSIIATGYYRLGIWQDEPVDPVQELFEDLDDVVKTTGEVFLGVTIGCARCHDHKLDPIPQRDYYRFLAFFRNLRRYGVRSHDTVVDASVRTIGSEEEKRQHAALIADHAQQVKRNKKDLRQIESKLKADLVGVELDEWKTEAARIELAKKRVGGLFTPEEFDHYVELTQERDRLRAAKPPGLMQALCVKEHGRSSPPTHVLVRGNAHAQGQEVRPGFPSVLGQTEPDIELPPAGVPSTGRRRALAQWIISPDNPLTARVIVNRVWQHHFGRGIVRSSSDFGFQGSAPTHPELLDWLASDFMAGGWRFKRLHKLIMLSRAYQMSSKSRPMALQKDPLNDLFWRFNPRRLSAEEIRDSILAVNGTLNAKLYGPSMYPVLAPEVLAGQSRPGDGWGTSSAEQRARRSIYIHVKRSLGVPLIAAFDGPDTDASCPERFVTTQPTQALGMLNSDFLNDQAQRFAQHLRKHSGGGTQEQVALALRRTLQRPVTPDEVARGVDLVMKLRRQHELTAEDAFQQFCLLAYNLNEFIYLD